MKTQLCFDLFVAEHREQLVLQCIASLVSPHFAEQVVAFDDLVRDERAGDSLLWGIYAQTRWQRTSGRWSVNDDGRIAQQTWWSAMNARLIAPLLLALCAVHKKRVSISGLVTSDAMVEAWMDHASQPLDNATYWKCHSKALDLAAPECAHLLNDMPVLERQFALGWIVTAHDLGKLDVVSTTRDLAISNNRIFLPPCVLTESSSSSSKLSEQQHAFVRRVQRRRPTLNPKL
jgi:hypothetical protein